MAKFVFILPFLVATSLGSFLFNTGATYSAPICSLHQSCSISFSKGSLNTPALNLCRCPQEQFCSEENSIDVPGETRYAFCKPIHVHSCANGEVSLVIEEIQTTVYCACPEDFELKKFEAAAMKNANGKKDYPAVFFRCFPKAADLNVF